MQEKLTIQDIARLAGVSKATVSRVLNNNPSVNSDMRERVLRVVQEYNFVPNITAIGLAGGRTRLIGVLAPPLVWPSVPEIMRGVAEYIENTAYEIVLYSINFSNVERSHSDVLDRILALRLAAGLLAIFPGALSHHLVQHFQHGLPMVMIDDQEEPTRIPWVGIDNKASAYEATRYLIELGHRRIAHIMGPRHYFCAIERYEGYCQALQDAGITPDPDLLLQGTFEPVGGRRCAEELFSRDRSAWPSAIFAANDQMAYGVLEYTEQQGIRVPEDITVLGFDDNILSAHMRPPLTTIHQPFAEMGYKATEILLTMIDPNHRLGTGKRPGNEPPEYTFESAKTGDPVRIQLPTSLVVRASSGSSRQMPVGL
ncbi:MAG TPA: LacI family DNA-binding transcriptional regulator [Ktedonobacteraceae bacterium]|nr:LacI family DNA-binding transcriptional regulator [Ktedonobacteraceae bacterium]